MTQRSFMGVGPVGVTSQATVRRLVVAWQHPVQRRIEPIGFLTFNGHQYSFEYIENVRKIDDFRPLLGFPELSRRYESPSLFPIFAQRVMDPRRPDYQRYLHRLGLATTSTPWEQMTRAEGRRQGDALQLFPEPQIFDNRFSCTFLVHGIRRLSEGYLLVGGRHFELSRMDVEQTLGAVRPGDRLLLLDESNDLVNPQAVMVATATGVPLGWLPDLLINDIHRCEVGEVEATVVCVNDNQTPWHLRLVAKLSGRVPDGFRFFDGPGWRPIPD